MSWLFLSSNLDSDGAMSTAEADFTFYGADSARDDFAGWAVAGAGDVDGDDLADLLVSAPADDGSTGATYLVLATDLGGSFEIVLDGTVHAFLGEAAGDLAGYSIAGVDDVNGDGLDDLLLGAHSNDTRGGTDAGAAYLLLSP